MPTDVPSGLRLPTRVIGCVSPGKLRVIAGRGIGLMDGGVETDIDIDAVPVDLRTPNSEFLLSIVEGTPRVERLKRNEGNLTALAKRKHYATHNREFAVMLLVAFALAVVFAGWILWRTYTDAR